MAWKGIASAIFTGGSRQMAVMGELLHRKCNAQYFQMSRTISRESFHPSTPAPAGTMRCAMLIPDAQRIFTNYDASDCWNPT